MAPFLFESIFTFSKKVNLKIQKKIIFHLVSLLFFQNCLYTNVSNTFSTPIQKSYKEKIRVFALIKGYACVEICSQNDKSPVCLGKEKDSCKNFAFGWYPVEFIRDEKYFKVSPAYPVKKYKFLYNLPTHLLKKYTTGVHSTIEYSPIQSLRELEAAYPKGQFKNSLFVKILDFDRKTHWSGIVSIFTLLLFPGFFKEFINIEISFFDNEGKPTVLNPNLPFLKHWLGWIFFLWGPLFSDNEKDLISSSLESLLGN
ncbi:MAG: hypothetical protein L6Q54_14995 [Leptospiraceae bacterium]|nr:hypothetical protein [Leptospiraceae bacterium]MCK6382540.1 hypothetical protein [Leptospiraceae bacterium]NUM41274.1 hypothetical protein [Leptospiraceae bacterium]